LAYKSSYLIIESRVFPEAFKEPENYSIQRMSGVYALSMIFPEVFERCREAQHDQHRYSEENMVNLLRQMGLESEFWHKDPQRGDPRSMGTGMKSVKLLAAYLRGQLPQLELAGL
jgi:hypothetical protein